MTLRACSIFITLTLTLALALATAGTAHADRWSETNARPASQVHTLGFNATPTHAHRRPTRARRERIQPHNAVRELRGVSPDLSDAPSAEASPGLGGVVAVGAAQLGLQYGALMLMKPPNWRDHGNSTRPTWRKFRSNFTRLPAWSPEGMGGGGFRGYLQADGDNWTTNVIGHGLQGSEIHLRMRKAGYSVPLSLLAGVIHSTAWEYFVEGWNETPSLWDLLYTPVGGLVMGEMRYHLSESLADQAEDDYFARGLVFAIDPITIAF
ncbi:DUF3943 domain-containing protein [Haliangium sp.]|uniref:DUF3943 domain-containing protein n=1 Tax=Haliangium sp. TaxID=2663208 RepID=UPI003D0A4629